MIGFVLKFMFGEKLAGLVFWAIITTAQSYAPLPPPSFTERFGEWQIIESHSSLHEVGVCADYTQAAQCGFLGGQQ